MLSYAKLQNVLLASRSTQERGGVRSSRLIRPAEEKQGTDGGANGGGGVDGGGNQGGGVAGGETGEDGNVSGSTGGVTGRCAPTGMSWLGGGVAGAF